MKYWGVTLFVLLVCTSAWGQANQFRFISALHAAKASFDTIETKNKKEPTVFKGGTAINVGSSASSAGTINIQGFPIQINTLTMDDGTQLSDSSSNKWLVNTLQIGANGNVVVGTLIAHQVSLENKENGVTRVEVTEELLIKGSAWTQTGSASNTLSAKGKNNSGKFQFQENNPSQFAGKGATWKALAKTEWEQSKTIPDAGQYFPISVN